MRCTARHLLASGGIGKNSLFWQLKWSLRGLLSICRAARVKANISKAAVSCEGLGDNLKRGKTESELSSLVPYMCETVWDLQQSRKSPPQTARNFLKPPTQSLHQPGSPCSQDGRARNAHGQLSKPFAAAAERGAGGSKVGFARTRTTPPPL